MKQAIFGFQNHFYNICIEGFLLKNKIATKISLFNIINGLLNTWFTTTYNVFILCSYFTFSSPAFFTYLFLALGTICIFSLGMKKDKGDGGERK